VAVERAGNASAVDPASRPGRLSVDSTPSGATVSVDGQRIGVTPLTAESIQAGNHRVEVSGSMATATHSVTVEPGGTSAVIVRLPDYGWLDVRSPLELTLSEGQRQLGSSGDGPVNLTAGRHTVTARNSALRYEETLAVSITPGAVSSVRPKLPTGTLQLNAQPWAHVFVDGEAIGDTPLGNVKVAIGRHEVTFRHPQLGERSRQVVVSTVTPTHLSVDLR
jgi:hypothetical protein